MDRPVPADTVTARGRTEDPGETPDQRTAVDERLWTELDQQISEWWETDTTRATEDEIVRAGSTPADAGTLMFLPFPYIPPSGSVGTFTTMFAWDTPDFTSRALLAHGRFDLARGHILNYLFMVSRIGYMPNANHTSSASRSQTPLVADTVWRYYLSTDDGDLLEQAYPLLKLNYREYWNADHHRTPVGLATNRDLGDPFWPPELAAEAETGWDWTPIYGGDVRRCVPLITNCALVRYARVLALIAGRLGRAAEAALFDDDADRRSELIRRYCWNEDAGFFVEYDYVAQQQLPYLSACALYPLWAGIATPDQARLLIDHLSSLEKPHGLACTDRAYPDPHPNSYPGLQPGIPEIAPDVPPEMVGGLGQLQWMYPAGWAPEHIVAVQGLDAYGFTEAATRIAGKFLGLLVNQYGKTGRLWEKYNVVDGTLVLPNSRCGNAPLRGWSAAAAVLLGRRLFHDETLAP